MKSGSSMRPRRGRTPSSFPFSHSTLRRVGVHFADVDPGFRPGLFIFGPPGPGRLGSAGSVGPHGDWFQELFKTPKRQGHKLAKPSMRSANVPPPSGTPTGRFTSAVTVSPHPASVPIPRAELSDTNNVQDPFGSMALNASSIAVRGNESETIDGSALRPSGCHSPVKVPPFGFITVW